MTESFNFEFRHPFGGEMSLVRVDGSEGLGELFQFNVQFVDNDPEADLLSADDAVGVSMGVTWDFAWSDSGFESGENLKRDIHGLCTDFRCLGWVDDRRLYELTLRPQLWLATQKTNSRFFLDKSLNDIIGQILDENGVSPSTISFSHSTDTLHYTVQYQETDFAFISRLLEKYGVTYYFVHSESQHEVLFVDPTGGAGAAGELPYHPVEGGITPDRYISSVSATSRLRTNLAAVRDWDPNSAAAVLEGDGSTDRSHASAGNETFIYPAGWDSPNSGHGGDLAAVAAEIETAQSQRLLVAGYVPDLVPGNTFSIGDNPVAGSGTSYVVLRAHHTVEAQDAFRSGSGGEGGYFGSYEAIPDTLRYPPQRITPWPRIWGPQTAIVVKSEDAPSDEEIDIDTEGRILVQFHWDREAKPSCRVRVAHGWAGDGWGILFTPRIGMEVVVDFLGGDPDRPLVTGCVYNSENQLDDSGQLPDFKTRSVILSRSSKGGNGCNMLGFEDLKDEEKVYLRAEKDMLRRVLNDDDLEVTKDQTITIGGNRTTEITGGDDILNIKGESVEDKYGNSIGGTGNREVTIDKGNDTLTISEGDRETTISQGDDTLTVSQGDLTVSVSSGKIAMDAAQEIKMTVGSSTLTISPDKISLDAPQIEIKASAQLNAEGGMTTVKASGILTIQGSMVKIN